MDQDPKLKNNSVWKLLNLAWELGYTIAIPVAIFGFGGAYADKKFETSPLFILIGIGFALILTGIGVYRKIKQLNK